MNIVSPLQQAQQAALSVNHTIRKSILLSSLFYGLIKNEILETLQQSTSSTAVDLNPPVSTGSPQLAAQQQQQQQQQKLQSVELTENQKQLLGMTNVDDPTASLEQQVELTLRGKDQRLMLMQKLMQRKQESKVLILRNMVGPEDVDEFLESEITGK